MLDNHWKVSVPVATICVAAAASLVGLMLLNTESRGLLVIGVGAIGISLACLGAFYTARHREWVIVALLLADQLMGSELISEHAQRLGHYLLGFLICVPIVPFVRRYGILGKGGFKLYAIYFCWALVTVAYSINPAVSAGRFLLAASGFAAISVSVFEARNPKDVIGLYERVVLSCAVVLAIIAATAAFGPYDFSWSVGDKFDQESLQYLRNLNSNGVARFHGIFGSPNQVGTLMLITVGPALICWPTSRGWKRIALALAVLTSVIFGVLADSRTAFVALAVGAGLYFVWKYRSRGVVACIVFSLVLWFSASQLGLPRGHASEGDGSDIATLSGRTEVWQFTVGEITKHPFTGYGYEVAGEIFRTHVFPLWWGPWDMGAHISVHNAYLSRAVGLGVPALLLWLFIVLRPWVVLFRGDIDPWNLKPIALLVFVPILVHALTESSAGDFIYEVGLILGLTWALGERQRLLMMGQDLAARAEFWERLPPAVAAVAGAPIPRAGRGHLSFD